MPLTYRGEGAKRDSLTGNVSERLSFPDSLSVPAGTVFTFIFGSVKKMAHQMVLVRVL